MDLNNWSWGAPYFDDMYSYPTGMGGTGGTYSFPPPPSGSTTTQTPSAPSTSTTTTTTTTRSTAPTMAGTGTGGRIVTQQPRNLTTRTTLPTREALITAVQQRQPVAVQPPTSVTKIVAPIVIGGGGGGGGVAEEPAPAEEPTSTETKDAKKGNKNKLLILGGVAALALYFTMR